MLMRSKFKTILCFLKFENIIICDNYNYHTLLEFRVFEDNGFPIVPLTSQKLKVE